MGQAGGKFYGTEVLTCGIWCHLRVDGIRSKLNCRVPSCVSRKHLVWGETSTHLVPQSEVCCVKVKETHRGETRRKDPGSSLHKRGKTEFLPKCSPMVNPPFYVKQVSCSYSTSLLTLLALTVGMGIYLFTSSLDISSLQSITAFISSLVLSLEYLSN